MALAPVLEIADAVAAELNTASFSLPFIAERKYVPIYRMAEADGLKVQVVAAELSAATALTRSRLYDLEYVIHVGIQQAIPRSGEALDASAIDPLMVLAAEVVGHFQGRTLETDGGLSVACSAVANRPIYDPKLLDSERVFVSVVALTFKVVR